MHKTFKCTRREKPKRLLLQGGNGDWLKRRRRKRTNKKKAAVLVLVKVYSDDDAWVYTHTNKQTGADCQHLDSVIYIEFQWVIYWLFCAFLVGWSVLFGWPGCDDEWVEWMKFDHLSGERNESKTTTGEESLFECFSNWWNDSIRLNLIVLDGNQSYYLLSEIEWVSVRVQRFK